MSKPISSLLLLLLVIAGCKKDAKTAASDYPHTPQDDLLHLNEIQIIASHNSYRLHTTDTVFKYLYQIQSLLPSNLNPDGLDYTHVDFDEQMSTYGIRGLEIDIYNDPNGGDFANRKINDFVNLPIESGVADLNAPGFKVLHIKDVDYNTHYFTFKKALEAVRNWSDAHPHHLPLFINVETKQDAPGDNSTLAGFGFQKAIPWSASAADKLDEEVKAVFGENTDKLITPDKLRGNLATLEDAAKQKKWPTLYDSRGKIILIMQGNAESYYKAGHPSLQGRTMFVYSAPGTPEAAFVILNNPTSQKATITQRVQEGYIVRTRSDADTQEARTGDYTDMNNAFSSGAQITSTDYYKPDLRGGIDSGWTTFSVKFPEGSIARKNPVNAAGIDVDIKIEK